MRLSIAFCSVWLMWLALGNADEPNIFCFYTNSAMTKSGYERMRISDIDPNLCTHLVWGSIGITENGDVMIVNAKIDLPDNGGQDSIRKFNALRKKNERLKTLVSTNDWDGGSAKYSKVAANTSLRSKYVKNVVDFVRRYEFDGLNINWAWPTVNGGSPDDLQNYPLLLKELRENFDEHNLTLSINVEGRESHAKNHYDIPEISKYPHFIILETDCHKPEDSIIGHNSPLYPAARETSALDRSRNYGAAVSYWLGEGAPAEKIIMGTRFFGIGYTLKNWTEHVPGSAACGPTRYNLNLGYIGYDEICRLTSQDVWTTVWDKEQHVPYSYAGNRWISYDNVRSLTEKGKYVKAMGLGGVMALTIDIDDHQGGCGERYPLLKALNCGLREIACSALPAPEASTPPKIADCVAISKSLQRIKSPH